MTEKRFVNNFQGKKLVSVRDNEHNCNVNILQIVEIANKLANENEQLKKSVKRQQSSNEECSKYIQEVVKENEQLKSTNMEMEDYIGRLEKQIVLIIDQFNYIQNSITAKIKNQKTKIGEKALREVIEDYNEWMLGHKKVM